MKRHQVIVSQDQGQTPASPGHLCSLGTKYQEYVFLFPFENDFILFATIILTVQVQMIKIVAIVNTLVNILPNISLSVSTRVCICSSYSRTILFMLFCNLPFPSTIFNGIASMLTNMAACHCCRIYIWCIRHV